MVFQHQEFHGLKLKVLPDFNDNGHLIEGRRPKRGDIVVFRYPKMKQFTM